jgi:indole-3-glycerol phosphate synthase
VTESTFLTRIIDYKRAELARLQGVVREEELEMVAGAAPRPRAFVERLDSRRLGVIAEIKRASPSKGAIALDLDALTQARRYADGGADAVSVLTDRQFYHGSVEDLKAVRAAVPMPVLYKDFVLARYKLLEARLCGADIVLLIVAVLGRDALPVLMRETQALGMTPLVEVYTRDEAEIALEAGATLIGINNRDLHTFEVSLQTTERLAPLLAPHALVVSLSGIGGAEDARRVVAAGARAVLVGEALVRSDDPAALIQQLKAVPLEAAPELTAEGAP